MGKTLETRSSIHDDRCGNDTWYGWKTPGSDGQASVSTLFQGSGSARLSIKNCHVSGSIDVRLSTKKNRTESKIATALANGKNYEASFDFVEGTVLSIIAKGGIVKMNFLSILCSGKSSNTYLSRSLS